MFAIHITLNSEGKKALFESIQSHIDSLNELPELLKQHKIKDSYVKSIEIIDSKQWDGWRY